MRRAALRVALMALFLHIFVYIAEATYTESDALLSPPDCTSDRDCMVQDMFAICEFFNITGVELEGRCVCDADNSYYKNADQCVFHGRLGDFCRPGDTICLTANTKCITDGENHGTYRCSCKRGYVEVQHNSTQQCARISHSQKDTACSHCESNGGLCYYTDDDAIQYKCMCPEYTSGEDCQNSHVNVTCDMRKFSMIICYSPHSWFDVSAGGAMFVESHPDLPCEAVPATGQPCLSGQLQLVLPLAEGSRQRCNTLQIAPNVLTKKYENLIAVQKKLDYFSPGDFTFRASCAFQTHATTKHNPVDVDGIIQDRRGLHHTAELNLLVENQLGQTLAKNQPIRLGDNIRLILSLVDNSIFKAIKVTKCLASSSAVMSDQEAVTVPLLLDSCPAADQTYLTNENNWQRISDNACVLRTGLITMFKLSQGSSLHIHCSVKLCIKQLETDCDPVTCETPASHLGYGRRKRSPETKNIMVTRKLIWYKEKPLKTVTGDTVHKGPVLKFPVYPVLIGGFVAFMVLFLLIVAVLICKLHVRQAKKQKKLTENKI